MSFKSAFWLNLATRIVADPEVVHGRPRIAGTRMRVMDVLDLLAAGATVDEITEDVQACIAYAAAQSDRAVLHAA